MRWRDPHRHIWSLCCVPHTVSVFSLLLLSDTATDNDYDDDDVMLHLCLNPTCPTSQRITTTFTSTSSHFFTKKHHHHHHHYYHHHNNNRICNVNPSRSKLHAATSLTSTLSCTTLYMMISREPMLALPWPWSRRLGWRRGKLPTTSSRLCET